MHLYSRPRKILRLGSPYPECKINFIFPGKSYNDILNDTGLRTLKERRDVLCMKYFAEIQGSAHKLNGLLPALRKVDYDLRPGLTDTHWQGIEPTDMVIP